MKDGMEPHLQRIFLFFFSLFPKNFQTFRPQVWVVNIAGWDFRSAHDCMHEVMMSLVCWS